jgi:hypothetical protein
MCHIQVRARLRKRFQTANSIYSVYDATKTQTANRIYSVYDATKTMEIGVTEAAKRISGENFHIFRLFSPFLPPYTSHLQPLVSREFSYIQV